MAKVVFQGHDVYVEESKQDIDSMIGNVSVGSAWKLRKTPMFWTYTNKITGEKVAIQILKPLLMGRKAA